MSWSRSSSRRWFLRSLSLAPAAVLLVGASRARAQDAATPASACPVDRSDGLPDTLQFVEVTENPEQPCRACAFWAADDTGQCGACEMMRRPTPAMGHCMSWAVRDGNHAAH